MWWEGRRIGEREKISSRFPAQREPKVGLDSAILRSRPEEKSRVGHSTD